MCPGFLNDLYKVINLICLEFNKTCIISLSYKVDCFMILILRQMHLSFIKTMLRLYWDRLQNANQITQHSLL